MSHRIGTFNTLESEVLDILSCLIEALRDYRKAQNLAYLFIQSRRIACEECEAKTLYCDYQQWCRERGEAPTTRTAFEREAMKLLEMRYKGAGRIVYLDVAGSERWEEINEQAERDLIEAESDPLNCSDCPPSGVVEQPKATPGGPESKTAK